MANTILYSFSLWLLLSAAYSKPVASDSKTVQSFDTAHVDEMDKSNMFDSKPVVTLDVESSLVEELDRSLPAAGRVAQPDAVVALDLADSGSKRFRRQVINGNGCASDRIWFKNQCMTFKAYEITLEDDNEKRRKK